MKTIIYTCMRRLLVLIIAGMSFTSLWGAPWVEVTILSYSQNTAQVQATLHDYTGQIQSATFYRNGGSAASFEPNTEIYTFTATIYNVYANDVISCKIMLNVLDGYTGSVTVPNTPPPPPPTYTVSINCSNAVSVDHTSKVIHLCDGRDYTFTASSNVPYPSYYWIYDEEEIYTSSLSGSGSSFTVGWPAIRSGAKIKLRAVGSGVDRSTIYTIAAQSSTPSVSVAATNQSICSGTNVTFTATPTNGGTSPQYQWMKNDVNISGATAASYTTTSLANNDKINVRLTSNEACATSTSVTSKNPITMTVRSKLTPEVSISSPATSICPGSSVEFTATPTNGGTSPQYQWIKGSSVVQTTTTNKWSTTSIANNDKFTVKLISSESCVTSSTVTSTNSVTMTLKTKLTPTVSMTASPQPVYQGNPVTFKATPTNGGTTPQYQWIKGSSAVQTTTTNDWSTTSVTNGDKFSVKLTSSESCVTSSTATSNVITMSVTPLIMGDALSNPIVVGTKSEDFQYSDIRNTDNFTNQYNGQPAKDVFYQFILTRKMNIVITHCGSSLSDTYLSLLDASGSLITYNDDYQGEGGCPFYRHAYLKRELAAGTYYVVSEGKNSTNGSIQTNIQGTVTIEVTPDVSRNYIQAIVPLTETINVATLPAEQAMQTIEYFDGLGRPMQTVAVGASPDRKDIITPITYDAFGRQDKQFLPYVETDNITGTYRPAALSQQKTFYNTPPTGILADAVAFDSTVFEPSPLNRVTQQYGPGKAWKDGNKRQVSAYQANITTDKVRWWKITASGIDGTTFYGVSKLYKTIVDDEIGNRTITYTDLQERVVQQEQVIGTANAITQYVYDDFGRLAYVVQPAYHETTNPTYTINENDSQFGNYVFAYHYDEKSRVKEKHIPGAGWTHIVYNKLDQPVMTQSAVQRSITTAANREWNFTKYDAHGRVVMTGMLKSSKTRVNWQTDVDAANALQWEERTTVTGNMRGYTNRSQPVIADTNIGQVNYYDNYDFTGAETYTGGDGRVQGMLTGTTVRVLESNPDKWLTTTLYYDKKGQLKYSVGNNLKSGSDKITNDYDFTGKMIFSTREHTGGGLPVTLTTKNKYDHAGRLLTVKQHVGGDTITVAQNTYNAIGQLVQTQLHNGIESTGYEYNIRGWLTSIGGKHFSERLHYQDAVSGLTTTAQWNGNISAMEWKTTGLNDYWHAYAYSYDKMGRLLKGLYSRAKTTADESAYGVETNYYNEDYTYDLNGNMKTLNRWHSGKQIDNVTFDPVGNGNRVTSTSDALTFNINDMETLSTAPGAGVKSNCRGYELLPGFTFAATATSTLTLKTDQTKCPPEDTGYEGSGTGTYDASGRLIKDTNKNIDILYNHLDLVKQVTQGTKKLKYTYDGSGRRLQRTLPDNTVRTYIDGIEYQGNNIDFIATPYGRIRKNGTGSWVYDYFLKDHLGNVRVVMDTDPVNTTMYMASMEEGKAGEESLYFENLETTRADRPYNYPDNNPTNVKLAKVPGKSQGPKITLKVMAGDTVAVSARAFYNIDKTLPGQGVDVMPVLGSAIAALASAGTAPLGEASQLAADLGTTVSESVALLPVSPPSEGSGEVTPESGLKFVVYNENFDVVDANTGVLMVDDKINTIQTLASDRIVIQESGYLEVYADNQAQTPVFFDNMMVTLSAGATREVNAYYPYGKIISTLSTSGTYALNSYKYNSKELQTSFDLNWLDYGARMLDGPRWFVPDPLAEDYYNLSPYAYCANNPILFIDPNGESHYQILGDGTIICYEENDDEYDRLYSSDQDGNINRDNYININNKYIMPSLIEKRKSDAKNPMRTTRHQLLISKATTGEKSADDMFNVFFFAASNSDSEWKITRHTDNDGNNLITVGTLYETDFVGSPEDFAINSDNVNASMHSHPGKDLIDKQSELESMGYGSAYQTGDWQRVSRGGITHPSYVYIKNSGRIYHVTKERPILKNNYNKSNWRMLK